ncbi:sigma 54-interacting transcriptional regulator [Desulfopila sp. IMCC35008]|uniref:sigma 54-interacting transcriptional regulator n=1 Tax=Desulfopila sp. IMCC35008 TaxID=2653858 RepID=UPI0013D27F9A|nr:sigma 54-interacting transcriptional regulator [Desulfopila sp. IMCC35008]
MAESQIEFTPQGEHGYITVDSNWLITSCNGTASKILDIPECTLQGKDCREIFCSDDRFRQICSHLKPLSRNRAGKSEQIRLTTHTATTNTPIALEVITLPSDKGGLAGAYIGFSDFSTPLAASRLALNSIAEGVFTVDHDWKITSWNSAAERITGFSEEDVLDRPCKSIFKSTICKKDCAIAKSIQACSNVTNPSVYIATKRGRYVPVQVSAAPLVDMEKNIIGGVETFRDMTARVQHELILDAVADGVFTVNSRGHVTSFNRAAEKITGWSEEEVLGKSCSEVLLSSINVASCPLTICMREKRTIVDTELFIINKNGFSIPVSVSAAPFLDHQGYVIGGVESFRDNTNRLQTALILDSVADGVFTVDRDWRITSFNQGAEIITGWSREKALGQFCSDVFHSSICGKNCAIAEALYTGKPVANRSISIQAFDNICTPVSISAAPLVDHDGNVVGGVETFRDLRVEINLRRQLMRNFTFESIISKSPAMQRLFQILPEISLSESNVLILGESGTGKELIAKAIFNASGRKDKPFVAVNCGALPETLLESELFGYKTGAFTDAKKDKEGRFAAAEGGTLFLDEIGDIPQSLQVKLLRVLQEKVYEPLGSNTPVKADVRILAATNRDLGQLVQEGLFRDDLFYRLNVANIVLPPLRERIEDIPLLVDHFVENFRAEKQKDISGVSDEVMVRLMRYHYPGNIRELENIIEYSFILCPGGQIQESHLPESMSEENMGTPAITLAGSRRMTLEELEKQAILLALERNSWKKMKTCRELGISKDTLRRKLRSYGLGEPRKS